ncbi:aldo/keto reductase, partial [Streptomyces carpinensis]
LGEDGPEVGVQGLGCMGMSFAYGPTDTEASRATLERALELGVTLYDTADAYGAGENERFLSPFFRAHRDEV